jgi:hypothetical protein
MGDPFQHGGSLASPAATAKPPKMSSCSTPFGTGTAAAERSRPPVTVANQAEGDSGIRFPERMPLMISVLAHQHAPAPLAVAILRLAPEDGLGIAIRAFQPPAALAAAVALVVSVDIAVDEDLPDLVLVRMPADIREQLLRLAMLARQREPEPPSLGCRPRARRRSASRPSSRDCLRI